MKWIHHMCVEVEMIFKSSMLSHRRELWNKTIDEQSCNFLQIVTQMCAFCRIVLSLTACSWIRLRNFLSPPRAVLEQLDKTRYCAFVCEKVESSENDSRDVRCNFYIIPTKLCFIYYFESWKDDFMRDSYYGYWVKLKIWFKKTPAL